MTTTTERWVRRWYGLTLHTDRPDFELNVSATGTLAAAQAAGFTTALDTTDDLLAAQLASDGRGRVERPVRLLAAARDLAWQAITAFAAAARKAGFASRSTGATRRWTPVCVHAHAIGSKAYPALARTKRPDAAVRFTRTTTEGDDIAPPEATCVSATVSCREVVDMEVPARIADGYTVLGGVLPTFDRATVEPIADALASVRIGDLPGEHPLVTLHGDIAVICWEVDDGRDNPRDVEVDRVHTTGRYVVGGYLRPWTVASGEVTR